MEKHRKIWSYAFVGGAIGVMVLAGLIGELRMRTHLERHAPWLKDRDIVIDGMNSVEERLLHLERRVGSLNENITSHLEEEEGP